MIGGAASPDPFVLPRPYLDVLEIQTVGKIVRSPIINPALKTLVLIGSGQSLICNVCGTAYSITNGSVIDNFNIWDGAIYNCSGPLLGCMTSTIGPGNILPRIADKFITAGKFDRVILVPLGMGGTSVADWATGQFTDYHMVAMRRLASRGITPATPGVTFAILWMQGEAEAALGTTSQQYQDRWATVRSKIVAAGFSGRIFNPTETMNGGTTNATIQGAQAAIRDNVLVYSGGNFDADVSAGNRSDSTHPNPTGAGLGATSIYNAMVASGAPF